MRTNNQRIWDHADEADRLADLVQRRLYDRYPIGTHSQDWMLNLVAAIRTELAAIKRLSNDRPGGA